MENRVTPKYIIDFCTVRTTYDDIVDNMIIFEGFDVTINQSIPHNSVNPIIENELQIKGNFVKNVSADVFKNITFDIQAHRTDVIEILKYGNLLKMSGSGIITQYKFPEYKGGVFEITIKVNGEIN